MIRVLTKEYGGSVETIAGLLDKEAVEYDIYVSRSNKQLSDVLVDSVSFEAVFLIGDTGSWSEMLAETFGLALVYDKFAEKNIRERCKLMNSQLPAQYVIDRYCTLPETFIHYSSVFSLQCGFGGEYGKCRVYVLPDDSKECANIFKNYVKRALFRHNVASPVYSFKVFGLSKRDIESKISTLNTKNVSVRCETENLDGKIVLSFHNLPKKAVLESIDSVRKLFGASIYSTEDVLLSEVVVRELNGMCKTVATAESVTGGLITSSLVEVPGASNALYEGAVTYTIDSKATRLGISPHFIDQYGVVSSQVAKEMALSQLSRADFSVATTGFAGPTADGKNPVGLCFVAIGGKIGGKKLVKVFKNVYNGDRNSIREQVANTAMYLLHCALTDVGFFAAK